MNTSNRPQRRKNLSAMRMVGAQTQAARKAAGYTQRSLAEAVLADEETIASIEQGRRPLLPDLARTLDKLLNTKGTLEAGVENMPEIDRFALYAEQYVEHEREAIAISWYECTTVPGLLQTPEYVRALFRDRVPAYSEDEITTKTSARIERQDILQRKSPPTLSFVLWEPLLHARVGGEEVRRGQLHHLRETAELPGLSLQILPLDAPSHAGLGGPFILFETPDHQHLGYAESQIGSVWIGNPDDVSNRAHKYAMLRAQALSPHGSKGRLDRLLGEL